MNLPAIAIAAALPVPYCWAFRTFFFLWIVPYLPCAGDCDCFSSARRGAVQILTMVTRYR